MKQGIIFLLISFNTLFIYAQDDTNITEEEKVLYLSLKEAKAYGMENHPSVRSSMIDVQLANERINEVKSIGFPQVNAKVDLLYYPKLPVTILPGTFNPQQEIVFVEARNMSDEVVQKAIPVTVIDQATGLPIPGPESEVTFGTKHNLSAGISASQLVFDASYLVGLKLARVYSKLSNQQARKTALDTQYDIEQTYLSALIAAENIVLLEKNMPTLERILFETTQLYENGFAEEIETDRIQLSKSNIETQIRNLREQERLAKELLRFQMGYPTKEKIALTDSIEVFMDFNIEYLDSLYFTNKRIEFDILDTQKLLNELQIERTKSQFYPNLVGFADYNWTSQRDKFFKFKDSWFDTFVLGLSLNIPIFDGRMKHSQMETSRLNVKKLDIARELTQQGFDIEMKSAITNYQTALEEKLNQEKNLALAEKIYNTGLIKYREGLGSSLEVNSSESTFLQTQASYINSLYSLVLAKAELNKAYGNY